MVAQYLHEGAVDLLRQLVVDQRAMAAELRELRQALQAITAGVAPDATEALIAAVYAVASDRWFRSSELIAMSHRPGVPEQALRRLLGDRSPCAVGVLLGPMVGQVCASTSLVLSTPSGRPGRQGRTWRVSPTRTRANC